MTPDPVEVTPTLPGVTQDPCRIRSAVCLFVRDEEHDIAEWMAYHLAIGFDSIIVFENYCSDRTPDIVADFGTQYDVRLQEWPAKSSRAQVGAYLSCLSQFGREFDWIAFIDADELILPRKGNIRDLLAAHEDAAGVFINWAMFGSSGHRTRPPGLMIETFTRRAKSDYSRCKVGKFICRPSRVINVRDQCFFDVDGSVVWPSGRPVRWSARGGSNMAEHSVAQLNHYFTRSRDDWERKWRIGNPGAADGYVRDVGTFAKNDRNELLDRGALRFLPEVREILSKVGSV